MYGRRGPLHGSNKKWSILICWFIYCIMKSNQIQKKYYTVNIYPPTLAFAKAGVDPVFLEPLPRPHCRQTPPQGHRNGARAPHGRSNGFFYRLPFVRSLKPSKPSNSSKSLPNSAGEKAPHGRSNGFFYRRSRLPICQASKVPNAPHPRQVRPAPQGKGTPTRPRRATPACKTPNFAGKPLLLGRSSLPFARLQTLKTLKIPRRRLHPTAAAMASFIGCRLRSLKPSKPSNSSKSLPNSAGKRHPTAAAMASFIGVQGCHLPGLKGSKRSTPSTSPPSSAGKRYPNKAKTRHSCMQNAQLRRQASVVRAFKPAVCQASNP